jgi:hypothetical protein
MVPVSNVVATAVVGMPERTDVSAAVTVLDEVIEMSRGTGTRGGVARI